MKNEDEKNELVGQNIAVYLEGGWSISGTVKRTDSNKIFIENNSEFYMVYRDKISAVCLNYSSKKISPKKQSVASQNDAPSWPGEQVSSLSEELSLSLPLDMLTEDAQKSYDDNDFSIQFNNNDFSSGGQDK